MHLLLKAHGVPRGTRLIAGGPRIRRTFATCSKLMRRVGARQRQGERLTCGLSLWPYFGFDEIGWLEFRRIGVRHILRQQPLALLVPIHFCTKRGESRNVIDRHRRSLRSECPLGTFCRPWLIFGKQSLVANGKVCDTRSALGLNRHVLQFVLDHQDELVAGLRQSSPTPETGLGSASQPLPAASRTTSSSPSAGPERRGLDSSGEVQLDIQRRPRHGDVEPDPASECLRGECPNYVGHSGNGGRTL